MKNTKITDPWGDTVTIKLFRDNDRYRDDLYVALNGRRYRIRRGVAVELPRCVAEIISQSEEQQKKTEALIDEISGKN